MLDWLFAHGRWPTADEWRLASETNPPAITVRQVFGSWRNAKIAAGWRISTENPVAKRCVGCDTELDNLTRDCNVCQNRHRKRLLMAA